MKWLSGGIACSLRSVVPLSMIAHMKWNREYANLKVFSIGLGDSDL